MNAGVNSVVMPGADRRAPVPRGRLIRKYVGLFAAVVSGALLISGASEIWFSYQDHKALLLRLQREQAETAATRISQFVREIEGQLGWTTQLPWSAAPLDQRRLDALRLLRQAPAITELAQLDPAGKEQLRVSRLATDVVGSGADFSKDETFTEALARKVHYSPLYFRRESEPYMTIALAGAQRDAGVSVAEVNLKQIWDIVAGIRVGERGVAYVVDAAGRLIAHPDISLVLRNTSLAQLPHVAAARAGSDEVKEARDGQGQPVLTAYAPIPTTGWLVFAESPLDEAYASLSRSLRRLGLLLLAAVGLAGLAGTLLARRMIVPIQTLRTGAARIGAGELDQRVDIRTGDELEALAGEFNTMAGRLRESYSNLEQKVEQRTGELSEALEQQSATADVLKAVSRSAFDLQAVLDTLAESAARLCAADQVVLTRLRDGRHHMDATFGLSDEFRDYLEHNPYGEGRGTVTGRALDEGRPVQILDVLADPEYTLLTGQKLGGWRSALGVPLLRDGKPIGALALLRRNVQEFTGKQVELVETFADQAVIAIEIVRLFDEVQARTKELTEALQQQVATGDILRAIASSPTDITPVLSAVAQSACQLCEAYDAVVLLRDGDDLVFDAHHGPIPINLERWPLNRHWTAGRAVLDRVPVHVEDLSKEAGEFPDGYQMARQMGHRTTLSVPLLREGEGIGALVVRRTEVQPFSPKQIALLQTFADQAVIAIENVRLFDEVQARTRALAEALEQQTATSDVLKVISRSPNDLQPIFASIAQTARRLCKADIASIVALRAGEYRLVATDGVRNEHLQQLLSEGPIPLDRGSITGRVVLERRTIQVEDVQADAEFKLFIGVANDDRRSMLGVPLMLDDEVVGIIVMSRYVVQRFSDKQIELIETFADQAVIAIQNVRLFDEVQARTGELTEALRYQTATADVLQVISRSAFDLQSVLDVLIESACRLCGAEHAFLFQRSGEVYRVAASHGFTTEFVEWMKLQRVSPGRGTLVGRVALEGGIVHIPDATVDPEYTWHEALAIGKMRTMLGVPLLRDGQPIGSLSLVRLVVKPFTDRQIELVKTFADQAVIAIENARLFGEVQARTRELARSVEELQALSDVGRAVTSTLDVKEVLSTIVSRAVELSGADAGAIYKYRKSSGTFRLAEACNMGDELVSALKSIRIDAEGTAMGDAARTLQPVMVADLAHRKSYPVRDISLAAGFRSALIVPLAVPERTLGALVLQRRDVGEFPASIVRLTQTFANQSVLAIQNARFFQELAEKSEELRLASQHKSQFLANMSHELRTPLNAILGYAELLIDGIYGEMPEKPRAVLDRVQQNGQHLLSLINDVLDLSKIEAGELKLTIDDYALPSLVQSAVAATDSLARTKGLVLITDVPENLPVGRGDARRLSQVLLNLVGNAIKFTDTGEVTIAASAPNDRFLIAVRDTGPGISAADQEKIFEEFQQIDSSSTREKGGSGLGLAIAKQIVEMHGGQISVSSALGKGSTFCIEIPVRAVAQESAS